MDNLIQSPHLPYAQYMREGWNKVDIKAKLPGFIDYSSNPGIISPILEKIADNPVGMLTLCLLYQARHNAPKERLRIFVDDRETEYVKDAYGKMSIWAENKHNSVIMIFVYI